MSRYLMWVLWPSFLAAGIGTGIVFTLLDPTELVILGHPVTVSRNGIYSLGFFILWAICAAASALSCFLQATHHLEDLNNRRP